MQHTAQQAQAVFKCDKATAVLLCLALIIPMQSLRSIKENNTVYFKPQVINIAILSIHLKGLLAVKGSEYCSALTEIQLGYLPDTSQVS